MLDGLDGLVRGDLPYADAVVLDTDGREIQVEVRANTLDYDGTPAVLLHVRDVTARRESEAALRRREALLRTVVENAPVVLFAIAEDGTFTLADDTGATTTVAVGCGSEATLSLATAGLNWVTIASVAGRSWDFAIDDVPIATAVHPALTTVRQPLVQMGQEMARLLLAAIDGQDDPGPVVLPTELVHRESA